MTPVSFFGALLIAVSVLVAYRIGYATGYSSGRDAGFDDGKREGAREGSMRGYAVGFDRGKRRAESAEDVADEPPKLQGTFVIVAGLLIGAFVVFMIATSSNRLPDRRTDPANLNSSDVTPSLSPLPKRDEPSI